MYICLKGETFSVYIVAQVKYLQIIIHIYIHMNIFKYIYSDIYYAQRFLPSYLPLQNFLPQQTPFLPREARNLQGTLLFPESD